MTKERVFDVWAPPTARWSPWVKPTLFAYLDTPPAPAAEDTSIPEPDLSFLPAQPTVLVLDLPGPEAVALAVPLARRGYRPVPLYNALPRPTLLPMAGLSATAVDVQPILVALYRATAALQTIALPDDAPPAFLLDANRRIGRVTPGPGDFDNRSVCFPTDFPSVNTLLHQGLERVLLIQWTGSQPQPDLAHTLRAWQAGGVTLMTKNLESPDPPSPLRVPPLSRLRVLLDRFRLLLNLRRHPLGGFGGILPLPSAG